MSERVAFEATTFTAILGPLLWEKFFVRESTDGRDRYAVAVIKDGVAIGHLPRKVLRVCSLFLRRGGTIHCRVTGGRRFSSDLPQGGLEVLCKILFYS